jgi:hypothetical protein
MPRAPYLVSMSLPVFALAACASPAPAAPAEVRVLVQVAAPAGDALRIAEAVGRASGVPARYLGASGGDWHALALVCADACDAAVERLRADRVRFPAVQRDERKRIVTP